MALPNSCKVCIMGWMLEINDTHRKCASCGYIEENPKKKKPKKEPSQTETR